MADLVTFLAPAVTRLKDLVQSHSSSQDEVYKICCQIAYSQIKKLCNREFRDASEEADISEIYFEVTEGILFPKTYPIVSVEKLEYFDGNEYEELVLNDDYRVPGTNDRIVFYYGDTWNEIRLTYRAGYTSIDQNEALIDGVVQQAMMIYKKKDFVAMANRADLSPGAISSADIKLLPVVKDIICDLIRYGE